MRDKRESTRSNAAAATEQEVLAGRLPKVLAARLRSARTAVGMSQGLVAKAMADRGFSWRQTTVAKSEAAVRPVLFAEVAALSQIYRRPIDYFLYPGTTLDGLLDDAKSEMEGIRRAIDETDRQMMMLRGEGEFFERKIGLASSLVRYRNTSDSGVFMEDLRALLHRWGPRMLQLEEVFEAVDLTVAQVEAVDYEAVREIVEAEWQAYQSLTESQLRDEGASGKMLLALSDFLEGKKVPPGFIGEMREGADWVEVITPKLTDLLIDAIHAQEAFD
ncbi:MULTISPECIES: hypothetical protein [unclassified Streptomyces]|uniref:hypothetical protein n=1 Tax=unclassified Streptomyces TaxID=2593676 RepID=UPI0036760674